MHVHCTFFLLLVVPAFAQEHHTFTVPFDLQAGLIRLKGELNGKPAPLPLDTGANNSTVDVHSAFLAQSPGVRKWICRTCRAAWVCAWLDSLAQMF